LNITVQEDVLRTAQAGLLKIMDKPEKHSLLYVDDDKQNLFLFQSLFGHLYLVFTATSGKEALAILSEHSIQVLFADQRMPEMNGIQLLEKITGQYPDIIRILVTGYSDIDVAIDAINRGSVYHYISKPWNNEEVTTTAKNAVEIFELKKRNTALISSLDTQNKLLRHKVEELKFLNQLSLELRGKNSFEELLTISIERLKGQLDAEEALYYRLDSQQQCNITVSLRSLPVNEEILNFLKKQELEIKDEILTIDYRKEKRLYLIPLSFQDSNFGCLIFSISIPEDHTDIPFLEAAADIVVSNLHRHQTYKQDLLKEQYMILGQMAGTVIHDLKGPMSTMRGFIDLLGQGNLKSTERQEYSTILNREVERLKDMIEELLSFAKGERHLNLKPIRFESFLKEILHLYDICFQKEKITVLVVPSPVKESERIESFTGDSCKLKEVFINLLNNARQALSKNSGPRNIWITSCILDGRVMIRVKNNGPQIPEHLLSNLFDPFVSYGKEKGTGLGLTICRKIIEEHRGSIHAWSDAEATEFIIQLPLSISD